MIDRLRRFAAFRHLTEPKLDELAAVLSIQSAPAGQIIAEEGGSGDTMFFIADGEVRIEKRVETGGAKELALLVPGDSFGEIALIEKSPRSARAVAQTDTLLFVLGRDGLDRWLRSDPLTIVGFFVELLRVASHRVRILSEEIVLLYDLGHLTADRFEDAAIFLRAVLHRLIAHLEGEWSGAAYLYDEFSQTVSRVGTEGPRGETLPETHPADAPESHWLDDASFCLVLSAKDGAPLGSLIARNAKAMTTRERREFGLALTAAAHLLASALQNIRHDIEERLRARLDDQRWPGLGAPEA
jgi:CRP/FNR family transcriptional regulator, cyclic AMP receptor protein